MRIKKATKYAILAAAYLAKQPKGKPVGLAEISKKRNIPKSFLAKISQVLTTADIMKSHRGLKGGFSLARAASSITIREIIEEMEGPIVFEKCIEDPRECRFSKKCSLNKLWKRARNNLVEVFEKTTLVDLR